MMKRLIALAALSAASAAAMYIVKKMETKSTNEASMRNPVHVVTKEVFAEAGIKVDVPENAVNVFWLTIEGIPTLYSLDFFVDGNEYNLRIKKSDKLEDISGMYYSWAEERTVSDGDTRAVIQTIDNEAGICLWYKDGYTVSLSMRGSVTMDEIKSMFQLLNNSLVFGL
ncbi:MAG: hypothetical protein IKG47_06775 [Oscillospiraceae bacterium]|nr:hypothetical protein [Oscillospiraceae bacterium]